MCGPSSQETSVEASQQAFYDQMTKEYSTVFGENQSILQSLTKSFAPVLAGGINQQGFSPAELQTLNNQATQGTGENYKAASDALSKQQSAEGGGTSYIPTGAKMQQQEQLATSAAQNESGIESNILASDYATGRANYLEAAGILGGVAAQDNPASFAGATTGAGSSAASTAENITASNNSWMNLVSGAIGATGAAFTGAGKNL